MSKKKILIVDDDLYIRDLLITTLSDDNIIILEASNGKEAIDIVKEHKPDLVLLDIAMPKLNGIQTCKLIKQIDKKIKVIIVSGTGTENEEELHNLEVDDYFQKPFSPLLLLSKLELMGFFDN